MTLHSTRMSEHLNIPADAFAVQYIIKGQFKRHLRLTFGGSLDLVNQLRLFVEDGAIEDLHIIDHCGRRLFTCLATTFQAVG